MSTTNTFGLLRQAAEEYIISRQGRGGRRQGVDHHVAVILLADLAGRERKCHHPALWGWEKVRTQEGNRIVSEMARMLTEGSGGAAFFPSRDGKIMFRLGGETIQVDGTHGPPGWRLELAREGIKRASSFDAFIRWMKASSIVMEEVRAVME
jgi:hypothetical protein